VTTILDRITIAGIASAGLCAVAVTLTPAAAATPMVEGGGYACMESAGAVAAAGAAPCAAPVAQAAAPIIPAAPPGPLVPVVPAAPVVPVVPAAPVVPVVPAAPAAPVIPAAAPVAGAPLLEMGGGIAGKGDPVGAPPSTEGVPSMPGPQT